MKYKDYYEIMGVKKDATQDEIKRAYRRLARKFHPDVSKEPDAEARFKEVGEAYEVLKDPEKRAAYDQLGSDWKAGQSFHPPPGWEQGFEFHGGGFTNANAGQYSDFFETLFGQGFGGFGRQPGQQSNLRGEDAYTKVSIDLEDAYHGATRSFSLKHSELGPDGRPQVKERTLNVRIPKGVYQGQHIRLAGQGSPSMGKGAAGDLLLEIQFKPHPRFKTEGKDVFLDLPIAPWEAALGATVKVDTPSGSVDLSIPPNSPSGRKLRLKGRGLPAKQPGDLYVVLRVVLPKAETEADKQAYENFKQSLDFNPRDDLR